jgi:hypothetical protein
VRYVRDNAKKHSGAEATGLLRQGQRLLDRLSSFVVFNDRRLTAGPAGFLLKRTCTLLSSA